MVSWTVDHPLRPSALPLFNEDLFLEIEEELKLKSFASIDALCPVLVPTGAPCCPIKSENMTSWLSRLPSKGVHRNCMAVFIL